MRAVAKYNTFKGISTTLSIGTPIVTMACCGDFFVHRSETAISAAGIFTILIAALFFKDKLAEKFKSPSALIIAVIGLIFTCLIENIVYPIKCVCIATMCACGVDELLFKRWYKQIETSLPNCYTNYSHFGFIFAKTQTIMDEAEKNSQQG
jgi:hypothetical protein